MADLKENDLVIDTLSQALLRGEGALKNIPALISRIIREGMWKDRVTRSGQRVKFTSFAEFVSTPPIDGLGEDLRTIKNLCRDDAEAIDLIDRATAKKDGRPKETVDNVNSLRPDGNSRQHALRKLRTDAPKLHAKVIKGELSAHAAMVEAGFRKKKTPLEQALYWYSRLSKADKKRFCEEVGI